MASVRASALISLGTVRRDAKLLDAAERSIKTAQAAGSDREFVDQLYRSLRKAGAELGAE
jgi:hypothetical protein